VKQAEFDREVSELADAILSREFDFSEFLEQSGLYDNPEFRLRLQSLANGAATPLGGMLADAVHEYACREVEAREFNQGRHRPKRPKYEPNQFAARLMGIPQEPRK
jgi:hypothetical protein